MSPCQTMNPSDIEKPLDNKSFVRRVKSLLPENGSGKHLGELLTQGEERVLKLVLGGKSNKDIANLLNRSKRTIEVHRAHVMHKLGVESLVDLVKRRSLAISQVQVKYRFSVVFATAIEVSSSMVETTQLLRSRRQGGYYG